MLARNTAKILRLLLRSSRVPGYNINQVAREAQVSVGSAFETLKGLERRGVVQRKEIGNAAYSTLDLENEETAKLCELLLLEEKRTLTGAARIYAEQLQTFPHAELIVLFGSILKKKEFNDVDVLFMTQKAREASAFCLEIGAVRTKPVLPLILKRADLIRTLAAGNDAVTAAMREGIVLKGTDTFIEVMRHAKDQARLVP